MREPRAALALVHAELLETDLNPGGEGRGGSGRVGEDEHPDRARFAIATDLELERPGRGSFAREQIDDRLENAAGLRPEECERDVLGPDRPGRREVSCSPLRELHGDVVGKLECEEEPEPVIPGGR
jgi:hypothetical protein